MSEEMDRIRKQNKDRQDELKKVYPTKIMWPCSHSGCKNHVFFNNESELREALKTGKPYCDECVSKGLAE